MNEKWIDAAFEPAARRGLAARYEAQKIAFGPVVFQCVRTAWKSGLLAQVEQAGKQGASVDELAEGGEWSSYAISVMLESALSAGVVMRRDGRYALTRVGDNVLFDELTQINIDYIHDVCYEGLFRLEEALREEKPLGLQSLGPWPTIYEGLSILPEPARTSWFNFDHYYSDSAFQQALPHVFRAAPQSIMDIGANTGKWSLQCLQHSDQVRMTLVDLPVQLAQAERTLSMAGVVARATLAPMDILDADKPFPASVDAVWMSQFLTCFSEEVVGHIMQRASAALNAGGCVWVLDTFWDLEAHEIARYCLINTSPYFTAMASGNSKMYESPTIIGCAERAGLRLKETIPGLGICHALLCFEKSASA